MNEVFDDVARWSRRGDRIAIAMVVGANRSAPRPLGSKMAVNERGEITGGVSGGCVEGTVAEVAERVLRGADAEFLRFGIADSDAWEVGLPCGGEIDVWVQAYEPGLFEEVARARGRAAEATLLEGVGAGAKLVVTADGARVGSLGAPELDARAVAAAEELLWLDASERRGPIFVDVVAPPPRLFVLGAVDIAASLCKLARVAGWRPYVIDPRRRFARPERFPDAEDVLVCWPEAAFAQLGGIDPATAIVALTHDPKLDDAALLIGLRSAAFFVGAMGSRRAHDSRVERLLALGLEDEVQRLSAPVGLDLGASSPAETALSVFAEIVAIRHGHLGGRLSTRPGRVHELVV